MRETASQVVDEVKSHGSDIIETAKERADRLAEQGKQAGSEQISGFASAIRNAADDLEGTSPEIAGHVRSAASSIEEISSALRDRSVGQLFQDLNVFARRQPAAFFGISAVAGFAIARFAKSSGSTTRRGMSQSQGQHRSYQTMHEPQPRADRAPGWVQTADESGARPATMAAATLGGAAAHRRDDALPGSMPTASEHQQPRPHLPAGEQTPTVPGTIPNERSGSQL
ncbi:MAG: hypothetical protein V4653_07550 [Pseudomonadota bacterium]